ncbi:hypothetical protein AVEN_156923-1 [Araneus ventricosus]|uniref:Uncharacterized protein n=1 Tax=Araneus ventricosus TaxID=182803 RepID=A0A4Y2EPG9_ARAVE|nr:hypothetical protein AVEN_156923-1 [Araneus ventricosus]
MQFVGFTPGNQSGNGFVAPICKNLWVFTPDDNDQVVCKSLNLTARRQDQIQSSAGNKIPKDGSTARSLWNSSLCLKSPLPITDFIDNVSILEVVLTRSNKFRGLFAVIKCSKILCLHTLSKAPATSNQRRQTLY